MGSIPLPFPRARVPQGSLGHLGEGLSDAGEGVKLAGTKAFSLPKLLVHRGRRAFANQIYLLGKLPFVTMWEGGC